MSKKILFAIDEMAGGGAEKVVLVLMKKLIELGHQPYLLTLGCKQDYQVDKDIPQLQVAPHFHAWHRCFRYRQHAKLIDKALDEKWSEIKFDLVLSNLQRCDRTLFHSKRLKKLNFWNCIHKPLSNAYLKPRSGLNRKLKKYKIRRLYNNAKLIGVSQGILDDLQKKFAVNFKKSVAIHNPFDIERIQQMSKETNPLSGENYLIHVGRFHSEKRHDRLLKAFAYSNFTGKLVLLGQGDKTIITKYINKFSLNDRVVLHGFTKNPFPLIAGARALLLSSDYEGFGNVLVEALICHTPVLSIDCPTGPKEILTNDLKRYLISSDDEKTFVTAINDIVENPPKIVPRHYLRFSAKDAVLRYLDLCE